MKHDVQMLFAQMELCGVPDDLTCDFLLRKRAEGKPSSHLERGLIGNDAALAHTLIKESLPHAE